MHKFGSNCLALVKKLPISWVLVSGRCVIRLISAVTNFRHHLQRPVGNPELTQTDRAVSKSSRSQLPRVSTLREAPYRGTRPLASRQISPR